MKKINPKNCLMASALMLPAVASASSAPVDSEFSYRYSSYVENDIADNIELIGGVKSRYEIDVHQLRLLTLIGDNNSLEVNWLGESLSGASPVATEKTANGVGLIMSGASISEKRQDTSARFTHYGESFSWGLEGGLSKENDYESTYISGDLGFSFNAKNTSLSVGFSTADDDLSPTDAEVFNRVLNAEKETSSFSLSLSQVLSSNNILLIGTSLTKSEGFLTDPYKTGDARPTTKEQKAYSVKLRSFVESADAALHLNYRYYSDDWKMQSDTIDIEWHQNFGSNMQLVPAIRYYSQGEAFFYEPYSPAVQPVFYSSDFRLSPYGALSLKLAFIQRFTSWSYTISYENYDSDADYSFNNVAVENPGLVDFKRLTLGFDIKW